MASSDLSVPGAPAKGSGAGRRAIIALAGLTLLTLAVNISATQFVAWHLGYHPALGEPVAASLYPPWRWWQWRQQRRRW